MQAGNNITYVITVTNQGPAAATTVTFNDAIPTNTTFVSFVQSGTVWSCPSPGSGGKVTCTIATLGIRRDDHFHAGRECGVRDGLGHGYFGYGQHFHRDAGFESFEQ